MKSVQFVVALATLAALAVPAMAQEQATTANSSGSIRPIPQSDQMFRKTIWRSLDLREKQNRPMFSEGKEISRIIIEAVKRGELQAYKGDSLTSTYTPQEMRSQTSYREEKLDVPGGDDWGSAPASGRPAAAPKPTNDGWNITPPAPAVASTRTERRARRDRNGKIMKDRRGNTLYETVKVPVAAPVVAAADMNLQPYRYKDLYQMEIKENMIFDKKRSRMYNEIQSVTLYVPASKNVKNVDLPIATFKYSDLVKVFRNNPQTAIWFNAQNDAQHKNLADAFELGLFSSYITKVSNVSDSNLTDVYGSQKQGILAAAQTAADLVEYEYSLWSF